MATMLVLFTAPPAYFAVATVVSTTCMLAASYSLGVFRGRPKPRPKSILIGAASAAVLYLLFYLGAAAIDSLHPFGITAASESSIYSLIASPSNPVFAQVGLLVLDSAGYESLFRGFALSRLQGRMGMFAAPTVALIDAGIHIATLNPVWVVATFVTDLTWGLTYQGGKLQASFTSHLLWDIAIFIVRPVV